MENRHWRCVSSRARRKADGLSIATNIKRASMLEERFLVDGAPWTGLGPVNTYLSASKMSTKWMKPMNITSSFSNRENIRR